MAADARSPVEPSEAGGRERRDTRDTDYAGSRGSSMSASASTAAGSFRRGWNYYRQYTRRRAGIHAAATAALTGFGLLAYFEQWFVAVAIASYLLPPAYLYLAGDDLADRAPGEHEDDSAVRQDAVAADGVDADSDADADPDGVDSDVDVDGTDVDADGVDADADVDGADVDADGADSDTDGVNADADGADVDFDG
jgi:hypothetical protein